MLQGMSSEGSFFSEHYILIRDWKMKSFQLGNLFNISSYFNCASKQSAESKKLSPSVTETLPMNALHEDSSSILVDSENMENISSSSTSVITPISKLE